MPRYFHVSSGINRASIEAHGLDWTRMAAARGIAGSQTPEVAGVFLCIDLGEVAFFLRFDATEQPVDVWAVDGIEESELVESPNGFLYLPRPVPRAALTRIPPPPQPPVTVHGPSAAGLP